MKGSRRAAHVLCLHLLAGSPALAFHGGFDHFHGYLDHVVGRGVDLFAAACERDLEGVVAKWRDSPYWLLVGGSPWVKVKNRAYSQVVGREERFEAWESVT
jgi:hypothetical protein